MTLRWSRAETLEQVLDGLHLDRGYRILAKNNGVWEIEGKLTFDISRAPLISVYALNGGVIILEGMRELLFLLSEILPHILNLAAICNVGPKIKTLLALATACEGSHGGIFGMEKALREHMLCFVISFVNAPQTHFSMMGNGHIVEMNHGVTLSFSDILAFIEQNDQLFTDNEMDDDEYMTNVEDAFYYSKVA